MTFYSAKFNRSFDFKQHLDTQELLNLQEECTTLKEFESILSAEDVEFTEYYVITNESYSHNQLSLL